VRGSHPLPYPPPYGRRPGSQGGGLAILVVMTLLASLAAPHARGLRDQAAAGLHAVPGLWLPALPAPPTVRAARPSPRAARAVTYALAQRGKPYRWAAEGPGAFDCSGLTFAAWRHAGVTIPRTAAGQLASLPRVSGRLRPGDLVIYASRGPSRRHVALVVDPGRMVEAPGRGVPVRQVRLRGGFIGAVRPGAGR
jgi:peptidoglycan DL-endopeptidase CwlO